MEKGKNNCSSLKKRKNIFAEHFIQWNNEYSTFDNKLGLRNGKDNSENLIGISKHGGNLENYFLIFSG